MYFVIKVVRFIIIIINVISKAGADVVRTITSDKMLNEKGEFLT